MWLFQWKFRRPEQTTSSMPQHLSVWPPARLPVVGIASAITPAPWALQQTVKGIPARLWSTVAGMGSRNKVAPKAVQRLMEMDGNPGEPPDWSTILDVYSTQTYCHCKHHLPKVDATQQTHQRLNILTLAAAQILLHHSNHAASRPPCPLLKSHCRTLDPVCTIDLTLKLAVFVMRIAFCVNAALERDKRPRWRCLGSPWENDREYQKLTNQWNSSY